MNSLRRKQQLPRRETSGSRGVDEEKKVVGKSRERERREERERERESL